MRISKGRLLLNHRVTYPSPWNFLRVRCSRKIRFTFAMQGYLKNHLRISQSVYTNRLELICPSITLVPVCGKIAKNDSENRKSRNYASEVWLLEDNGHRSRVCDGTIGEESQARYGGFAMLGNVTGSWREGERKSEAVAGSRVAFGEGLRR